jgi:hypothetical protein
MNTKVKDVIIFGGRAMDLVWLRIKSNNEFM